MAFVDVFPTRKPSIGPLRFDASLSEVHGTDVELTDAPIEGGSVVTDHAITMPKAITLVVASSSRPDELLSVPEPSRHLRQWRKLEALAESHEIVDVVTTLRVYTSMMITNIGTVRTKESTHALQISVRLRKVEFSSLDPSQAIADAAHDVALAATDIGAQQAALAAAAELAAFTALVTASRVSQSVPGLLPPGINVPG